MLRVVHGSFSANPGSCFATGSSQATLPPPTTPATTVDATGLDSDASWNTVSDATGPGSPTLRTPYPFAKTTLSR